MPTSLLVLTPSSAFAVGYKGSKQRTLNSSGFPGCSFNATRTRKDSVWSSKERRTLNGDESRSNEKKDRVNDSLLCFVKEGEESR